MSALANPEWAVEAARDKHYQDTPVSTAALLGGITGASVPLALAGWDTYNKRPVDWQQVAMGSAALGGVGAVGTSLAELLGRTATRTLGPEFKERRWRRDQDPHRWNSALRLAPLGLLLAAKYPLLKYLAEKQSSASDLAKAEAKVKKDLSEKEIESGVYSKGHFKWKGIDITIETAKGQTRSGTDRNGKSWSIVLRHNYGYIKGTKSAEPGDQMDVFIGPDLDSEIVFVIDQNKQDGNFDEHKSVIGVRNSADAKQLYLDNYSTGWKGFRSVTALTLEQFKAWLEKGDMKSPIKGQRLADFIKEASRREDEERQRRKAPYKVVQDTLPWLGGLSLAGAGVSEMLRRGAFTPALQEDMRDFSRKIESDNLFKPYAHLPQDEQVMQSMADYAIQGNKLLGNRLWGVVSPTSIIKALRSLPGVVKPQDRWTPDSSQHYDAFEASPASGMVRVLGELSQGGWRREDGTSSPRLPESVRDSLRKAVNNVAGMNYADTKGGNTGWNFPAIGMPTQLSRDQQLQLMRKVGPELKSELFKLPDGESLWQRFTDNVSSGRNTVYEGYGKLTNALQHINSGWAGLNAAMLGTGAASLGGLALWRYLDNRKKERQRKHLASRAQVQGQVN